MARIRDPALGRRLSKTVAGATSQDLYNGGNPVLELDGSNPPIRLGGGAGSA